MLISIVQQSDSKWFLCLIFKGMFMCYWLHHCLLSSRLQNVMGTTEHKLTSKVLAQRGSGSSTENTPSTQIKCHHWKCIFALNLPTWVCWKSSHLPFHSSPCVVMASRPLAGAVFKLSGDVNKLWGTASHWQQLLEGSDQWGSFVSIAGSPSTQEVSVLAV